MAVTNEVVKDLAVLLDEPSTRRTLGRLSATVGVLFQLTAWFSFSPDNEESAHLLDAVRVHEGQFDFLPARAAHLLREVLKGKGSRLAERRGRLGRQINQALFDASSKGFLTEHRLGLREPSLFATPSSARYVQDLAERCARRAELDFEDSDVLVDTWRDSEGVGALSVLLILRPCRIPPHRIRKWRAAYMKARPRPGEMEEGEAEWDANLRLAFRGLLNRFR